MLGCHGLALRQRGAETAGAVRAAVSCPHSGEHILGSQGGGGGSWEDGGLSSEAAGRDREPGSTGTSETAHGGAWSLPEAPGGPRPCLHSVGPPRTYDRRNHSPGDCLTPWPRRLVTQQHSMHASCPLQLSLLQGEVSEHPLGPPRSPCVLPQALKASAPSA